MPQQKSGNNPLFQQGHIKQGVSVPVRASTDSVPEDTATDEQRPEPVDDAPQR